MKKMGIICVTILAAAMAAHGAGGASIPENFSGWVDPFVGTSATGHTFPAACVPFGLVQAGPDTIGADGLWWHYCSGYRYEDGRIVGFSQTHLNGTGGIDLGDLLVLPFTGEVGNDNCSSKFRNVTEQASPGWYAVRLDDFGVVAEGAKRVRPDCHSKLPQ